MWRWRWVNSAGMRVVYCLVNGGRDEEKRVEMSAGLWVDTYSMPVFDLAVPYTRPQIVRRWIVGIVIFGAGVAFAIWAALDCSRIAFGYVASYSFAFVLYISVLVVFIGLPTCIYWRTRSTGIVLVVTGFLIYGTFLATIGVLKKFDKVAWVHEPPMRRFGPDQIASLVVYYRPTTTDAQIEDFVENKLENYPSSVHDGKDFPSFMIEYSALIPSQANGYEGSALTFDTGAKGPEVESFVAMIQSDSRVLRTFRSIAPEAIHLPKAEQAPEPSEHRDRRSR